MKASYGLTSQFRIPIIRESDDVEQTADMGSKRKIDEGAPSSKEKKVKKARQAAPQIVKVNSVRSARECAPVVASIPGLTQVPNITFQAYTRPVAKQQKKSKKVSPPELMLHGSTDRVEYTAKEDGDGGVDSHLAHYIGVFDPATGKLDVIQAKKMTMRATPKAQKAPEESAADAAYRVCFPHALLDLLVTNRLVDYDRAAEHTRYGVRYQESEESDRLHHRKRYWTGQIECGRRHYA